MSGLTGPEIAYAAKKASAWNTAVACGANNGFLALPAGVKKSADVDVDNSLGGGFSLDGTPGAIKVEGDRPMYLRYDGLTDLFLALFMGIAGAPTQLGGTIAYSNIYKWKKSIDGFFYTLAKLMGTAYVEEIATEKIMGITLKGEAGKPLTLTLKVIGTNKVQNTSSGTNTLTTFANVTIAEPANRVRFNQGVFRMNDQTAIALATGDKIYPSSFTLTADRKMKGTVTGEYLSTVSGNTQELTDEPGNDGMPEVTLQLTFARHSGTTYLSALGSDTRKKMDMTFTGSQIASPYNRQIKLEFPHLQLKNDDPADADGIISEPLDFIVHGASSAPAGMTGITDPFWISVINKRSTDPLA